MTIRSCFGNGFKLLITISSPKTREWKAIQIQHKYYGEKKDPTNNKHKTQICTKESIHFTMYICKLGLEIANKLTKTQEKAKPYPNETYFSKLNNQIPHKIHVTLLPLSIQQAQTWIDGRESEISSLHTCLTILQTLGVSTMYTYILIVNIHVIPTKMYVAENRSFYLFQWYLNLSTTTQHKY